LLIILPISFFVVNTAEAATFPSQVVEEYLTFTLHDSKDSYYVSSCSSWNAEGKLVIPEQVNGLPVTGIGSFAFFDCTFLTEIEIPYSVSVIGQHAFDACQGLTHITIPSSVTSIGKRPFSGCWSLEHIWVDKDNPNYSSDSVGVLYNKDMTRLICAPTVIYGSYTICDTVTEIDSWAFSECFYLQYNTYDNARYIGKRDNPFFALVTSDENVTQCRIHLNTKIVVGGAFYGSETLSDVYYSGTPAQWDSICVGENNDALYKAALHFDACVDGHVYDNEFDVTCNICEFTRQTSSTFEVINNYVRLEDNNAANTNHRVVCYYLGNKTVVDIYDEAALKAIDPAPVIYWGMDRINKTILLKPGNYALLLHYNEGKSAKKTVAVFTQATAMSEPVVEGLSADNRLVVRDKEAAHTNHRATVYALGDQTVENLFDESVLKRIDPHAKTYWGLQKINKVQIVKGGNYAIVLHYNLSNGVKRTVATSITVDLEKPVLSVWNGKLNVLDTKDQYINHRATVYYLAEGTVADIYDEAMLKAADPTATTYWGLDKINKVTLEQPGNYVVVLHYNLPKSEKLTVVAQLKK